MKDRTTRILAALALTVGLLALVVAGYAASMVSDVRDEVRALGSAIRGTTVDPPLRGPPPSLDPDDR